MENLKQIKQQLIHIKACILRHSEEDLKVREVRVLDLVSSQHHSRRRKDHTWSVAINHNQGRCQTNVLSIDKFHNYFYSIFVEMKVLVEMINRIPSNLELQLCINHSQSQVIPLQVMLEVDKHGVLISLSDIPIHKPWRPVTKKTLQIN